jgi:hypothetical protein
LLLLKLGNLITITYLLKKFSKISLPLLYSNQIVKSKSVATTTDFDFTMFLTPPPTLFVGGNHFYPSDKKRV